MNDATYELSEAEITLLRWTVNCLLSLLSATAVTVRSCSKISNNSDSFYRSVFIIISQGLGLGLTAIAAVGIVCSKRKRV